MKWKCVSQIVLGEPCDYNCTVELSFQPSGCLKSPVYQNWELEEEKDNE